MNRISIDPIAHPIRVSPERNLLVAMLSRAVFDFHGSTRSERDGAAEWLFSEDGIEEPFSFSWVCASLNLDIDQVRNRIRRYSPKDEFETQKWWIRPRAA